MSHSLQGQALGLLLLFSVGCIEGGLEGEILEFENAGFSDPENGTAELTVELSATGAIDASQAPQPTGNRNKVKKWRVNSCFGSGCTGSSVRGDCFCDPLCALSDDCCQDYAAICDKPPRDGGWSRWSKWSRCQLGCSGSYTKRRTRTCTRPEPLRGGKPCEGDFVALAQCIRPKRVSGPRRSPSCGLKEPRGRMCRCDPACTELGGCCVDYEQECGGSGSVEAESPEGGGGEVQWRPGWGPFGAWGECFCPDGDTAGQRSRVRQCVSLFPLQQGGPHCSDDGSLAYDLEPCSCEPYAVEPFGEDDPLAGEECEAASIGNGVCDAANNRARCEWDGGDCCQPTCNCGFACEQGCNCAISSMRSPQCGAWNFGMCLQPGPSFFMSLPSLPFFKSVTSRSIINSAGQQGGVSEMKFLVVDAHLANQVIFFVNSTFWHLHSDMARGLGLDIDAATFVSYGYFSENRQFVAGSLISRDNYVDPTTGQLGLITLQFWTTDPVNFKHVEMSYKLVVENAPWIKSRLRYLPVSATQTSLYDREKALYDASDVPVISQEELYSSVSYTGLNLGSCFGRLLVVRDSKVPSLSIQDLVVLRYIPNDITHVAGVITETPQTPLSHINLKAKQNNMPNAYIAHATTNPKLLELEGRYVKLTIGADSWAIEEADKQEYDTFFESIRPQNELVPSSDLTVRRIKRLTEIGHKDARAFGAKAANVGELRKILNVADQLFTVPDGFAVPFYFYDQFMKYKPTPNFLNLYEKYEVMSAQPDFIAVPAVRETQLEEFRKVITKAPVPEWILQELEVVHEKFHSLLGFKRSRTIRCRSSTNNEDLEGFNGAGLYSSFSHREEEGKLAKSVRQVWSSLWTYRAFEERSFYRIDHKKAYMGVLLHQATGDEVANGVAVTKNIYQPTYRGFYVNVQVGENLVTNPDVDSTPDEFVLTYLAGEGFNYRLEMQFLKHSNQVSGDETVLAPEQVERLVFNMDQIHSHFSRLYGVTPINDPESKFAMELEFKITAEIAEDHLPSPRLFIKQARPWVD